jgi:hypothetical protein
MTAVFFVTGCKPEDDPNNGSGNNDSVTTPTVTTMSVSDVTTNSAKSGGDVTDDGGSTVTERGICWSTNQMPTINDSHVNCGSGTGAFEGEMLDLLENTNYYVRAYATNSVGTSYGEEMSFQTEEAVPIYTIEVLADPGDYGEVIGGGSYERGQQCTVTALVYEGYSFVNWTENGEVVSLEDSYTFTVTGDRSLIANFDHAYVDLGLPTGTLWATCNVGATVPEGYGDYFAWGETEPKTAYDWSTYIHCKGACDQYIKYCNDPEYGYNGFTDDLTTLLPEDDAATAQWGSGWCMPTKEQWVELYQNTTQTWTTQNGVNGGLFTARNGNSIFIPAAGYCGDGVFNNVDLCNFYWSSSLDTSYPGYAWYFRGFSENYNVFRGYRYYGHSVRGVRSASQD